MRPPAGGLVTGAEPDPDMTNSRATTATTAGGLAGGRAASDDFDDHGDLDLAATLGDAA